LNVFVAFWISVDLVEASGFQFGALDKGFINFTNKFNVVVLIHKIESGALKMIFD